MSISQISPQGTMPSSRPPKRPSQGDLYDTERWESAYRDLHSTPTLLVQLQDEASRSRLREAFWISVIFHLLVVIAIVNSDWLAKLFPHHKVLLVTPVSPREKELTFLALPPDAETLKRRPNSNIISDKDRIAMSRKPHLDPDELRKILSAPPGPPGPAVPPQSSAQKTQPATPPVVAQSPALPAHQEQPARAAPPSGNNNEVAKLQAPPSPKSIFDAPRSASSSLEEAKHAAAANRGNGGGGSGGDYGLGGRQGTAEMGPFDVLSDTMGVDFGPYLIRVLHDVRENWYHLIPESARPPIMKKGKVTIEFAILKNGAVAGMQLDGPSGDGSLDRAAWGGIRDSNPFPPLPSEFGGDYLALRFHFFYNPDKADLY